MKSTEPELRMGGKDASAAEHSYYISLGLLIFASHSLHARAKTNSNVVKPEARKADPERDEQHDFDFLVGTWKLHLKRLEGRLVGSTKWVEFDGPTVCRKILNGRGEVEDVSVENPKTHAHIEGMALRLYNPKSHQWSIYWANGADGVLEQNPMVGQFSDGRGEFYNQQVYEGRAIFARFTWTDTTTSTPHFEQAFSADGGKTWETNWTTTHQRKGVGICCGEYRETIEERFSLR